VQRVIRCDCGFEATGISDDDLVPVAQAHARAAHDTEVSADMVLALARPHLGPAARPTKGET
jgi:predicted small metal-binding protein